MGTKLVCNAHEYRDWTVGECPNGGDLSIRESVDDPRAGVLSFRTIAVQPLATVFSEPSEEQLDFCDARCASRFFKAADVEHGKRMKVVARDSAVHHEGVRTMDEALVAAGYEAPARVTSTAARELEELVSPPARERGQPEAAEQIVDA